MGGAWRGGLRRQPDHESDREEGLNELGEAPPPYKARDSGGGAQHGVGVQASTGAGLTIPLRALGRNGRAAPKPPDYIDTLRPLPNTPDDSDRSIGEEETLRPSTGITMGDTIRPSTAGNVSNRSLEGDGSSQRSILPPDDDGEEGAGGQRANQGESSRSVDNHPQSR